MVGEPLGSAGHDVATVHSQGWSGLGDPDLWRKVSAEGRFFVTADKGFGDIRTYPPGSHAGILLLRPDRESIVEYRALVESVLERHELDALAGALIVATPRSVRIRRKPA